MTREIENYIAKYGLKGWTAEVRDTAGISCIVIIPAIDEYENIKKLLSSLSKNSARAIKQTLFLFVVNNKSTAEDRVKKNNLLTIEYLRNFVNRIAYDNEMSDAITSGLRLAIIDAATPGLELPDKDGGVGLARKIGMDMALSLFDNSAEGKKILVCLDADCTVSENYLTGIIDAFNVKGLAAAAVDFRHNYNNIIENAAGKGEAEIQVKKYAIICYEIFLRYYVLALSWAGSPYAFHTIGSTMACDINAYVKIGGMNKRLAAEDFYFMEKLAKSFNIECIKGPVVYPSSRGSWRVPFGTGQRVNRFLSEIEMPSDAGFISEEILPESEYLLYSPESFELLKKWLILFNAGGSRCAEELVEQAGEIHPELKKFLEVHKFVPAWNSILENTKSDAQLSYNRRSWFDGFRTLKLIHHLRDTVFAQVPMSEAVSWFLPEIMEKEEIKKISRKIPSLSFQIGMLEELRAIQ
jgi:glycosyltransferase involved in cell wall biosynthesis